MNKLLERILYALEDMGVITVTSDTLALRQAIRKLDKTELPEIIEV